MLTVKQTTIKALKAGDVIVNQATGSQRTVTEAPLPCRARGYFWVPTSDRAQPVNGHGSAVVFIKSELV